LLSLPAITAHEVLGPMLLDPSVVLSDPIAAFDISSLYRTLIDGFSYQGIRDSHARAYIAKHGNAEWYGIESALKEQPLCPKLNNFDSYRGCRYRKATISCANPEGLSTCPVPKLALRKGIL